MMPTNAELEFRSILKECVRAMGVSSLVGLSDRDPKLYVEFQNRLARFLGEAVNYGRNRKLVKSAEFYEGGDFVNECFLHIMKKFNEGKIPLKTEADCVRYLVSCIYHQNCSSYKKWKNNDTHLEESGWGMIPDSEANNTERASIARIEVNDILMKGLSTCSRFQAVCFLGTKCGRYTPATLAKKIDEVGFEEVACEVFEYAMKYYPLTSEHFSEFTNDNAPVYSNLEHLQKRIHDSNNKCKTKLIKAAESLHFRR